MAAKGQAQAPVVRDDVVALGGFAQHRQGLGRLAALVPRPRLHLIRFHGVLAPNAKLRPQIIPSAPVNAADDPIRPCREPQSSAPVRLRSARLLKRGSISIWNTAQTAAAP